MRLYNTLTRNIEEFIPIEEGKVKMYTCGPTVYHYAHIGNLRTYIFEDVLEKSLKYLGYVVNRAMNITDVGHMDSDADTGEDKMLKGAKREKKTVLEIAEMYTQAFFEDCDKLNIRKPDNIAKATDMVDEYIEMIKVLEKKGYTYFSNGNVYFDISKLENYTKLTNQKVDDLKVAVRDDIEEDKFKKNPLDFGLWFTKSKFDNQELKWDSPWGVGYPGWHIECSAIANKFLGEYIDIHCGGVDNIFPHHTNEIAQSETYWGHKWVNYWMHSGHLNDQTGKMSKSKGEFLTVELIESKGYNGLDYRFLVLQSHYRKQLVFSYETLDSARAALIKLKTKIQEILEDALTLNVKHENIKEYIDKFKNYIADDLNTANVVTLIFDIIKDENLNSAEKIYLINEMDKVLSLDLLILEEKEVSEEEKNIIEDLISKRNQAKANKDYVLADSIRGKLVDMKIEIKDTREGTMWEKV
ncbi:MAG TPA: cysteine--tRNA ligase [Clostridiales bacterium]|nr:MAG: cysteine--tRNA ligase [Clostridiales bacterium GWD2_32_59]HAN10393.1 cysteine--tRNA ligase [Clostridiales bacterium]